MDTNSFNNIQVKGSHPFRYLQEGKASLAERKKRRIFPKDRPRRKTEYKPTWVGKHTYGQSSKYPIVNTHESTAGKKMLALLQLKAINKTAI